MILLILLYALVSLTAASKWIDCYDRSHTPSPFIPDLLDCINLANHIISSPAASQPLVFSQHPVPEAYVRLPTGSFSETCHFSIYAEGPPYYDIASWAQIALGINETATECLGLNPYGGKGFGGRIRAGANRWLYIYVTGLMFPEEGGIKVNGTGDGEPSFVALNDIASDARSSQGKNEDDGGNIVSVDRRSEER